MVELLIENELSPHEVFVYSGIFWTFFRNHQPTQVGETLSFFFWKFLEFFMKGHWIYSRMEDFFPYSLHFTDFKLSFEEKLKFEEILVQNLSDAGLFKKNIGFS